MGFNCSTACGIFPDRGSNPCPLHHQGHSQPLHHQGSSDQGTFAGKQLVAFNWYQLCNISPLHTSGSFFDACVTSGSWLVRNEDSSTLPYLPFSFLSLFFFFSILLSSTKIKDLLKDSGHSVTDMLNILTTCSKTF